MRRTPQALLVGSKPSCCPLLSPLLTLLLVLLTPLSLLLSPAQVHLVDKKFGGELTKADVFGVEVGATRITVSRAETTHSY